jgi:hypothetical protein
MVYPSAQADYTGSALPFLKNAMLINIVRVALFESGFVYSIFSGRFMNETVRRRYHG